MENLAVSVLVHKPDIVRIGEWWLNADVDQYKIVLPKFVSVRLDRSRRGDGILLWIKDSVAYKVLQLGPQDLQLIYNAINLPRPKIFVLEFFIILLPLLLLSLIHY